MVKQASAVAWLIGIAALVAVTTWSGLDAVGHAAASVGWGIFLVVMVRGVTVSMAGIGWWLLFPLKTRPQLRTCVSLRFIREAINVLLPMAQIGGDLIGMGLLTLYGVPAALGVASVIVDVLLQAATQFLFAIIGLFALVALGADATLAWAATFGLGLGGLLLASFYLAQGRGGQRILHFALDRLTSDRNWPVLGTIDAVYRSLGTIYAVQSNLAPSIVVHMAGWLFGVAEVLIVFAFIGNPISLAEALVIESPLHAIRGAACHPQRAWGTGRRPGAAVRRVWNSGGTGGCVIACQADRRSRVRGTGARRLAAARMGTPHAELFTGRAASTRTHQSARTRSLRA